MNNQGAQGRGNDRPVGLSHAHIPSSSSLPPELSGRHVRDQALDRALVVGSEVLSGSSLGGMSPLPDHWDSGRVWPGGCSIGSGPVLGSGRHKRGRVTAFTSGAARRMRRYLQECNARYLYFGTLTLPAEYNEDPDRWRVLLDRWLSWLSRAMRAARESRGLDPGRCSVFWWVEYQSRGAPHLHVLYTTFIHWTLLRDRWVKFAVSAGVVDASDPAELDRFRSACSKFEQIRSRMASYVYKYASKNEQKAEGHQGRWWGVRGDRSSGSCQVTTVAGGKASGALRKAQELLLAAADAGEVRCLRWAEGSGYLFFWRQESPPACLSQVYIEFGRALLCAQAE